MPHLEIPHLEILLGSALALRRGLGLGLCHCMSVPIPRRRHDRPSVGETFERRLGLLMDAQLLARLAHRECQQRRSAPSVPIEA